MPVAQDRIEVRIDGGEAYAPKKLGFFEVTSTTDIAVSEASTGAIVYTFKTTVLSDEQIIRFELPGQLISGTYVATAVGQGGLPASATFVAQ